MPLQQLTANISQYPGKEMYNENKESNLVSSKKKCLPHRSVLQANKRSLGYLSGCPLLVKPLLLDRQAVAKNCSVINFQKETSVTGEVSLETKQKGFLTAPGKQRLHF